MLTTDDSFFATEDRLVSIVFVSRASMLARDPQRWESSCRTQCRSQGWTRPVACDVSRVVFFCSFSSGKTHGLVSRPSSTADRGSGGPSVPNKHHHLESQSKVPQQNPNSQCPLVKLRSLSVKLGPRVHEAQRHAVMAERRRVVRGAASGELDPEAMIASNTTFERAFAVLQSPS